MRARGTSGQGSPPVRPRRLAGKRLRAARGPLAAAGLALAFAASAYAQDFAGPAPVGPPPGPAGFLERALPPLGGTPCIEFIHVSLGGAPDLATRSAALGGSLRSLAGAVGFSQSGDAVLGWDTIALACGAARPGAAAAMRAVLRRDHAAEARLDPPDRGLGGEIGGGAWLLAGRGLRVWASAPQLWRHGAAVPLSRALEVGARIEGRDAEAWLAREAAPAGWRTAGDHAGGLALRAGGAVIWLEARDRPLRGAIGASAVLGPVRVAAAIDGHPVLGETARLSLAIGGKANRSPVSAAGMGSAGEAR